MMMIMRGRRRKRNVMVVDNVRVLTTRARRWTRPWNHGCVVSDCSRRRRRRGRVSRNRSRRSRERSGIM